MGLLPTPTASFGERGGKIDGESNHDTEIAFRKAIPQIMGMLPTPRVKGHGNSHQRIEDGKIDDLTTMAKRGMLPTPCTRDYKGDRKLTDGKNITQNGEEMGLSLEQKARILLDIPKATSKTSQLNPLFVAEMMGFPPDWTVLPFQSGETNQSRDTEMP